MKNLKKIIIFGGLLLIIFYCIYNYAKEKDYEEVIIEDVYTNTEEKEVIEDKNIIILHMIGEIKNPGIIEIEEGSRLIDAIEAAGGITEKADISKVNLAYVVSDGQKIYIPSYLDENIKNYIQDNIGDNIIIEDIYIKKSELVNINTAKQEELETITGIGPSTALKIINYRQENGKFKRVEDIKNVPGIGDAKFNALKNEICV